MPCCTTSALSPPRLDDGVQLEHGGVRATDGLLCLVDDPHGRVAEVDALRRIPAGHHGHAGDDRDDGRDRARGRERRSVGAELGEAHHPPPACTSTQRSALGVPDLPSRVTVTVAQTRSPSCAGTS